VGGEGVSGLLFRVVVCWRGLCACFAGALLPRSSLEEARNDRKSRNGGLLGGGGAGSGLDGTDRERMTRCITASAFSGPQCEAMTWKRGFGRWMAGGGDQGEVELRRLIVAVAMVWRMVCTVARPSGVVAFAVPVVCPCLCGNPEWRYVRRTWTYSVTVPPSWCSRSSIKSSEF
jgi:hypothetical protein